MPRQKQPLRPRHSHPELVEELAREMNVVGVSSTPETPTVYEEPQPYGNNLHVKVIWNRWAGIPVEERGAVVLDAYERAGLVDELRRITVALGLTPEEAHRLELN